MKAKLTGTTGEERAGGVATDAAGNVYQALAAGGSVNGQPFAGDKDLVLTKQAPNGTTLWTREIGTARLERAYGVAVDPQGDVVVTGYTNGDLDGAHAGNTTDDVFVVKYDPDGNREWLRQLGVPGLADRGYAIATDATGNVYVTGYTRGNLAGTNQGDKDVYLLKLDPSGAQVWLRQFGGGGEDKGWGVVATADGVRVAGMTSGTMGTPVGALDGWVARYDAAGSQVWLQQFGTAANEEVWGLTADAGGNAYVAAYSAGDFDGPLAGDKDLVVARFDASGALTWKDQVGTTLNDKGAAIQLDGAGNIYVAGFTDGKLAGRVGKFDVVLVKYAPDTTREWTRQFGTVEDDGADAFAEANLYLATHGGTVYVSGLTLGDVAGATQIGLGDVFLATFDARVKTTRVDDVGGAGTWPAPPMEGHQAVAASAPGRSVAPVAGSKKWNLLGSSASRICSPGRTSGPFGTSAVKSARRSVARSVARSRSSLAARTDSTSTGGASTVKSTCVAEPSSSTTATSTSISGQRRVRRAGVVEVLRADAEDHGVGRDVAGAPGLGERHAEAREQHGVIGERRVDEVHRRRADERGDEEVPRLAIEHLRRVDLLHGAVAHHGHARAERHRLDLVVRDVDRRHAEPLVQPRQLGAHVDAELRVEVRERLVHQERGRLADDGAAHRDPLPLPARERAGTPFEQLLEAEHARRPPQHDASISAFGVFRTLRPKPRFFATVRWG